MGIVRSKKAKSNRTETNIVEKIEDVEEIEVEPDPGECIFVLIDVRSH